MTQPAERPVAIRPLLYDRLRLYLGGQAEYIRDFLNEELKGLYRDLEALRLGKKPEAEIEEAKDQIVHLVNIKKDIDTGLLDDRMEFLKVRLYRGGQADYLRELFLDEQDRLLEHLAKLRTDGLTEDDEDIIEARQQITWLVSALRDLGTILINLAGPDADPR